MTLTGNHYLSRGYRIDAAWSDHPLTGFRPDPLNPILISTTGPVVGLGHSSSVTGPDLVSTWMAYHNINPDASRDLDLDRQVWSGTSLQVLGPSRSAPAPAAPDEWCDWDAGGASRWTSSAGQVEVRDSAGVLPGGGTVAMWDIDPGDVFTAELSLTGAGHGLMLDGSLVPLPEHLAAGALHCWRVVVDGGLRVSVDGFEVTIASQSAGTRLGVFAGSAPLRIGHVALTRTIAGAADRAARKPVPGRFWASLGERDGAAMRYDLHVQSPGPHRVYLAGEFGGGDTLALAVDDGPEQLVVPHGGLVAATLDRPAQDCTLTVRVAKGDPIPSLVTVTTVPRPGTASAADLVQDGYGKRLIDDGDWDDVDIDATLSVEFASGDAHADLLLRATQLAEGGEGDDTRLGIDFLLGYSVQLHRDRVVLARHAYDERVLAAHPAPIDPGTPHRIHLRARGATISVELDGRSLFDVHDPLPYPAGSVGIRTSNARLHVERLELAAGGLTPPDK
jgi:hypothetical protein